MSKLAGAHLAGAVFALAAMVTSGAVLAAPDAGLSGPAVKAETAKPAIQGIQLAQYIPPRPRYKYPHGPIGPRYRDRYGHFNHGPILGKYSAPRPYTAPGAYPAPGAYYGPVYQTTAHVDWCLARYRSYNPNTDTFMGYDGYRHRCVSPYR